MRKTFKLILFTLCAALLLSCMAIAAVADTSEPAVPAETEATEKSAAELLASVPNLETDYPAASYPFAVFVDGEFQIATEAWATDNPNESTYIHYALGWLKYKSNDASVKDADVTVVLRRNYAFRENTTYVDGYTYSSDLAFKSLTFDLNEFQYDYSKGQFFRLGLYGANESQTKYGFNFTIKNGKLFQSNWSALFIVATKTSSETAGKGINITLENCNLNGDKTAQLFQGMVDGSHNTDLGTAGAIKHPANTEAAADGAKFPIVLALKGTSINSSLYNFTNITNYERYISLTQVCGHIDADGDYICDDCGEQEKDISKFPADKYPFAIYVDGEYTAATEAWGNGNKHAVDYTHYAIGMVEHNADKWKDSDIKIVLRRNYALNENSVYQDSDTYSHKLAFKSLTLDLDGYQLNYSSRNFFRIYLENFGNTAAKYSQEKYGLNITVKNGKLYDKSWRTLFTVNMQTSGSHSLGKGINIVLEDIKFNSDSAASTLIRAYISNAYVTNNDISSAVSYNLPSSLEKFPIAITFVRTGLEMTEIEGGPFSNSITDVDFTTSKNLSFTHTCVHLDSDNNYACDYCKESTVAITEVNVAVGADLSMRYHTSLKTPDENIKMKFSMNGKDYYVTDYTVDENGYLVFTFDGIAPHQAAEKINAYLFYGEEFRCEKLNFSVEDYCKGALEVYKDDAATVQIIKNLLAYAYAAGVYMNVENNVAPVTEGVTTTAPTESSATISNTSATTYVSGAGVHFNNQNKLFFKIYSTEDFKVYVGEEELEVAALGNNEYIVYTASVLPKNYDDGCTVTVKVGEAAVSTVTYSVNTYCYNMKDTAIGALVVALYNFGLSCEAYAS